VATHSDTYQKNPSTITPHSQPCHGVGQLQLSWLYTAQHRDITPQWLDGRPGAAAPLPHACRQHSCQMPYESMLLNSSAARTNAQLLLACLHHGKQASLQVSVDTTANLQRQSSHRHTATHRPGYAYSIRNQTRFRSFSTPA